VYRVSWKGVASAVPIRVRGAHPSKTAKGEAAESCGGAKVGQPARTHSTTLLRDTRKGGADAAGNGIFSGDAQDVANAIQNADIGNADVFEQTWNGNTVYVNYSENAVGYSATGQYTNVYSIVVNGSSELVTAFPGFPY